MIFIKGNFDFLKGEYDDLFQLIDKMECNIITNPEIAIFFGGKYLEYLIDIIMNEEGIPIDNRPFDDINKLYDNKIISSNLRAEFHKARIIRNKGMHGNPNIEQAYQLHYLLFNITIWFYDRYSESQSFIKPSFDRLLIIEKNKQTPKLNDSPKSTIKRPFEAYTGNENYIFISYAHKDSKIVFPELKKFHNEGYPIWYDQGLTPGQEWDDEIANALMNCSLLVVFISKNSIDSTNVKDEIKLALKKNIDIVPIYFEYTELPPGLELRLSNKHAIMKYKMEEEDYIFECFKAFNKSKIPKI